MLYEICFYLFAYFVILKVVFKLTNGICQSNTCLIGKTALVTGGNSGIGYETALGLAARGCRVIIASRTSSEQIITKITETTNNCNITAKYLDLSSLDSIRKFAKELIESEERLDILVNNSGVAGFGNAYTKDGLHNVMQVNHFGPFLLTYLLIPLLKNSNHARILFVSSMLSFIHNLKGVKSLNKPYGKITSDKHMIMDLIVYGNSKLCNTIAARYFAYKLKGTGITANALHPGIVYTPIYGIAIAQHVPQFCSVLFYKILGFLLKSPFEGAQTTLHVALSKALENVSGKFFWDCIQFVMPPIVHNRDFCQQIIDETIRLTKMTKDEINV